jgi:SAM-dependent methyltransferase
MSRSAVDYLRHCKSLDDQTLYKFLSRNALGGVIGSKEERQALFDYVYTRMDAWSYESSMYDPVYSKVSEMIGPFVRDRSVIDLGCSFGSVWDYFSEETRPKVVYGVDISEKALQIAQEKRPPWFKPIHADILHDLGPACHSHVVMTTSILSHLDPPSKRLLMKRITTEWSPPLIITGAGGNDRSYVVTYPEKYGDYDLVMSWSMTNPQFPHLRSSDLNYGIWQRRSS